MTRDKILALRALIKDPTIDLEQLVNKLSPDDIAMLQHDWWLKARDKQLLPAGDWRWWILRSGRGFGKSYCGAQWTQYMAEHCHEYCNEQSPIIIIAGRVIDETQKQQAHLIIDIAPAWYKPRMGANQKTLIWPKHPKTGQTPQAWLYSGDVKDSSRGPNAYWAWLDELASWQYPDTTFSNINLALRVGRPSRGMITTTPNPLPFLRKLGVQHDVVTTVGSTRENTSLDPATLKAYERAYAGSRLGRQELEGEILADLNGALFNQTWIDRNRVFMPNRDSFMALVESMDKITIGVDPHGSDQDAEEAPHTGIIVGGRKGDIGYLFADLSTPEGPMAWANRICDAYRRFKANIVAAETNYGGKMVVANIHQANASIPVREISSRKGKDIRAEPISTLCEQNRIKFVEIGNEAEWTHDRGQFRKLEQQLTEWMLGQPSPDEMDAFVHCFTELLVEDDYSGIIHWMAANKPADKPKSNQPDYTVRINTT